MTNPFKNRAVSLSGPTQDILPVTPNDAVDLSDVAVALYTEIGGSIALVTASGQLRTVSVSDFSILPVGVQRVLATGTTASGIHAFVVS